MDYITLNEAITALIPIPGSSNTDTVTFVVYTSSGSTLTSGSMTFVADEIWKCTFTPTAVDTYVLKVNDTTISSKRENFYKAIGAAVQTPSSPSGDDLTTVTDFKIDFNIASSFTDHDTLIQNLITQKSKMISEYCGGRKFASQAYSSADDNTLYDGDGTSVLLTRQFPIVSVASLYDDTARVFGSNTLIDPSYYVINYTEGKIELDTILFSVGKRNIKVLYTAGYSTLPGDLVSACEQLVMADYLEHVASVNVASSDEVIYKPDKLRKDAWAVVERYKRYG